MCKKTEEYTNTTIPKSKGSSHTCRLLFEPPPSPKAPDCLIQSVHPETISHFGVLHGQWVLHSLEYMTQKPVWNHAILALACGKEVLEQGGSVGQGFCMWSFLPLVSKERLDVVVQVPRTILKKITQSFDQGGHTDIRQNSQSGLLLHQRHVATR